MIDSELCKGCISNSGGTPILCHFKPFFIDEFGMKRAKCPCSFCLVKFMCVNVCSKYMSYFNLVRGVIVLEEYELTNRMEKKDAI
jgi:hypothetical protein